jgi:TetR/AcrR family transcriptional repressor of nem operon
MLTRFDVGCSRKAPSLGMGDPRASAASRRAYERRLQAMIRSDAAPWRRRSAVGGDPEYIYASEVFPNLCRFLDPRMTYHFPTKAELGRRLIERYELSFLQALDAIDQTSADAGEQLRLRNDRMCLCGMLAAEYVTLPKPMKTKLKHFVDENERWLVAVLEKCHATGKLRFNGSAREVAQLLVGSLEGAMMLARSYADVARFESAAERLLAGLGANK